MIATTLTTVNVNIEMDRCQSGPTDDPLVTISLMETFLMISVSSARIPERATQDRLRCSTSDRCFSSKSWANSAGRRRDNLGGRVTNAMSDGS